MDQYHTQEMVRSLVEAGLVQNSQAAESVLSQYWTDKVAVVWTTEDVHAVQDNFDEDTETSSLSEEQAQSILQKAFDKHDANVGITWESLRHYSEELCN